MKVVVAAIALSLSLGSVVRADEAADRTAVLAVVDRFFDGMTTRDAKSWSEMWLPDSLLTSQSVQPDGSVKLRRSAIKDMIANLPTGAAMNEHVWRPTVMVRGPMAVVWAPYEFRLEGKRHHCGIDVFDLMKIDGDWKLVNAMWTSEPAACEELGAPKN